MEKKRFIAGAVCPRCELRDKIVMYTKGDTQFRECVECGFSDEIRIQAPVKELTTRVNQTESEQLGVVKILEPKSND